MERRQFITLLSGGAVAWPLAANAQKLERVRRIGMLVSFNDPDLKAFREELEKRGWSEGRNIHIDYRVAPAAAGVQTFAKELVAMQPEVIPAPSRPVTAALQKETHTIPIVFTYVIDPIGAGFISSLPRPGGNLTGIMAYEQDMVGKWLSMLKEIAPQTAHVALLGNPKTAVYYDYLLRAAEAAARSSLGIETIASRIENDPADIERVIAAVASAPNRAMIVLPESTTTANGKLIIALTARKSPTGVFTLSHGPCWRSYVYDIATADHYRQVA